MSFVCVSSNVCVIVGFLFVVFFFQAEDGIRDLVRSRGLGDVYKRQVLRQLWTRMQDVRAGVRGYEQMSH